MEPRNPLIAIWDAILLSVGIDRAELVSERYDASFGSGEAIFRVNSFLLRLIRDRGQDFVDVGPVHDTGDFVRFDDLCIALGWRDVKEVVARRETVSLYDELSDLLNRRLEVETALSEQQIEATRTKVRNAVHQRERAFTEMLRRLADEA